MTHEEKRDALLRRMLEVSVETYLINRVEGLGYLCEKHVSPGRKGPPDRLVTWPDGLDLVELKRPRCGKVEPLQREDHKRRAKIGQRVYLLKTKAEVDEYVEWRRIGVRPAHLYSPYV